MSAVGHLSLVPDPIPFDAYKALLDLLADDGEATARFEGACRRFVIFPDAEVLAFRSVLSRWGCRHTFEEVEAALYALALDELPGSWAAGRERLRRRVLDRDGGAVGAPPAATAVEDLLATETAWVREVWLLAEDPPDYERLREVSAKVWRELRRRGKEYPGEHFSEHIHEVLRAVFPSAPGAAWDSVWERALLRRAREHLREHGYLGVHGEVTKPFAEEMLAAKVAGDRACFRRAVRGWVVAARDAAAS